MAPSLWWDETLNGVDSVSDETVQLGGLLRQPVQDNLAVRPCEDVGGWDREDFHGVVKEFGQQECTLEFGLGNSDGVHGGNSGLGSDQGDCGRSVVVD